MFVYGTLRKKTATSMFHVLARYCEFFCNGYMQGKLYEIDGYPGAVESDAPDDIVFGEIYRVKVPEKAIPILDEYEGCTNNYPQPHEYLRKKIFISVVDGGSISAWVYIYNYDVTELKRINSGDYLSFIRNQNSTMPRKKLRGAVK